MTEKKKPGRKPGESKVKTLVSLPKATYANIESEAKGRKKPMSVPAFIAAALEPKFGVPSISPEETATKKAPEVHSKSASKAKHPTTQDEDETTCIHPINVRTKDKTNTCMACGKVVK